MNSLSNLLTLEMILLDVEVKEKEEIIKIASELLGKSKYVKDKKGLLDSLLKRESMGTTGIGHGVALPHARTNATEKLILSIIRTKEGIDFGSVDKEPVKLIFTVASPENETNSYMEVMSSIARILSKEKNRRKLNEAKNPKEFLALLKEIEEI